MSVLSLVEDIRGNSLRVALVTCRDSQRETGRYSGERSVERQRMFGTLTYSSWAAQPARIESHKAVREAVRDADAAYR